jgi:hypothetical protein
MLLGGLNKEKKTVESRSTCGADEKFNIRNFRRNTSKYHFVTSRSKWEDSIKMNLRGKGCEIVNMVQLPQDTFQLLAGFCKHGTANSRNIPAAGWLL